MDFYHIAYIVVVLLVLLTYVTFDLHYFLRMSLSMLLARFCKKRMHIMAETRVAGICITSDIDTLLTHMNNARFVRELDFARVDFYERTGLYRCIQRHGGSIAMGATTIRYRRFIKLFNRYSITTRVIYWDDQSIFMEHRFISARDQFVNAIVLSRTRLMNCSAEDVMNELLIDQQTDDVVDVDETKVKPMMPLDVAKWCEYNAISSAQLRADC